MKKNLLFLCTVALVFIMFAAIPNASNTARAQTVACPVGYTCVSIVPQTFGCPAGYTCTPISSNNSGYGVTGIGYAGISGGGYYNSGSRTITVTYPQSGNVLDDSGGKDSGLIAAIQWTNSNPNPNVTAGITLLSSSGQTVKYIAIVNNVASGIYYWKYDSTIPNGTYAIQVYEEGKDGISPVGTSGYFQIANSPYNGLSSTSAVPASPITITGVQYSPAYPQVNQLITATVTVVNNSMVNQTTPFKVDVQGSTVAIPYLAAGAKTTVTVPNAFSFAQPGTQTLNTEIIYPIAGSNGSGNTGNILTNTLTFTLANQYNNATLAAYCVPTSFNAGVPGMTWLSQVSGGQGTYQYSWSLYGDLSNYAAGNTQSYAVTANYSTPGTKQALLRVTDAAGNTTSVTCSGTIAGASMYPVSSPVIFTSPAANASLQLGQTYNITWTGYESGVSSYAVYLIGGPLGSTGSVFLGTAYPSGAGNAGTFSWTIGSSSYAPSGITPGSGYQIEFSGKGVTGGNSPSFNIVSNLNTNMYQSSITVVNPYSGEVITPSAWSPTMLIQWNNPAGFTSSNSLVSINFCNVTNQVATCPASGSTNVVGGLANSGQYQATLMSSNGSATPAGRYVVNITATRSDGATAFGSSANYFTIASPTSF